jgi:basic amino acid/polyamine antiporter, APA family
MTEPPSRLNRQLHTKDAVIIGLASMIGSGIFAAIGPATRAAGSGILLAVLIAAAIAYLNAISVAQLAAVYPQSGGAYIYGRKQLGLFWGFVAGWGFVIGKMASCTAMALTFGFYTLPDYAKFLGAGAVIFLTTTNYFGIKKTALVTRLIVTLVLFSLFGFIGLALMGGEIQTARLLDWKGQSSLWGILEASGLMFFAFAGYARIATLGEEVVAPKTTIPRAILISLAMTVVIYFTVIVSSLLVTDVGVISLSPAPLQTVIENGRFAHFSHLVKLGAGFGSLGVLLSLLAGVSRTTFAMAHNKDLPQYLGRVHPTHKVPYVAELVIGMIVATLTLFTDIRTSIGFSSFAVLTYYAIANLSAWKLKKEARIWPRWMSLLGFLTCIIVAFNLPQSSILSGLLLFMIGVIYYFLNQWLSRIQG